MAVKINMEMPKNCGGCPICSTEIGLTFTIYECPFVGTVDPDKRYKTCPLQEVKE